MTQGHQVTVFIACIVLLTSLSVQAQEKKIFERDLGNFCFACFTFNMFPLCK